MKLLFPFCSACVLMPLSASAAITWTNTWNVSTAIPDNDDSVFAPDIHTAIPLSGGTVTGTFASDGRNIDPLNVLATDARTATLSSFTGLDGNGTWKLFVADQSAGATSTLQS